jgi:pyrroloquinoline-quinone synthase
VDRIAELEAVVRQFDLNEHPFYQEWVMGTLPQEKLTDYAGEYGRFVATIAEGWETLGEAHYAAEERDHEVLWEKFKGAVSCEAISDRPQTEVLVGAARHLFKTRPEAIGALFAFEAQQPKTSRSKLDGLERHYAVAEEGKEYFAVHADDFCEVEDLKRHALELTDAEFGRAKKACTIVCAAMSSALDGVYYA